MLTAPTVIARCGFRVISWKRGLSKCRGCKEAVSGAGRLTRGFGPPEVEGRVFETLRVRVVPPRLSPTRGHEFKLLKVNLYGEVKLKNAKRFIPIPETKERRKIKKETEQEKTQTFR